eukprot:TRINITY_DN3103_c0_g1_i1.p1 TRINITY_DN3103_c0_g1~~TRINITY_DN3103_c0_g1_i1.p1  ORF type:complete len:876 (+),score=181.96 TRINITY_DN3103_c0_g1_i1:74-2629(+)
MPSTPQRRGGTPPPQRAARFAPSPSATSPGRPAPPALSPVAEAFLGAGSPAPRSPPARERPNHPPGGQPPTGAARPGRTVWAGPGADARCMLLSDLGVWAAAREGGLTVRSTADGTPLLEALPAAPTAPRVLCLAEVGAEVWAGRSDGEVARFRAATGAPAGAALPAPGSQTASCGVRCICPHLDCAFAGYGSGEIVRWSTGSTPTAVSRYRGHLQAVRSLLIRGAVLYSGSDDTTIAVWNPGAASRVGEWRGHCLGVHALCAAGRHVWSAGEDAAVRVWLPERLSGGGASGRCVKVWERAHAGAVTQLLPVGPSSVWSCGADGAVAVWDAAALCLLRTLQCDGGFGAALSLVVARRAVTHQVWAAGSGGVLVRWDAQGDCAADAALGPAQHQAEQLEHQLFDATRRCAELEARLDELTATGRGAVLTTLRAERDALRAAAADAALALAQARPQGERGGPPEQRGAGGSPPLEEDSGALGRRLRSGARAALEELTALRPKVDAARGATERRHRQLVRAVGAIGFRAEQGLPRRCWCSWRRWLQGRSRPAGRTTPPAQRGGRSPPPGRAALTSTDDEGAGAQDGSPRRRERVRRTSSRQRGAAPAGGGGADAAGRPRAQTPPPQRPRPRSRSAASRESTPRREAPRPQPRQGSPPLQRAQTETRGLRPAAEPGSESPPARPPLRLRAAGSADGAVGNAEGAAERTLPMLPLLPAGGGSPPRAPQAARKPATPQPAAQQPPVKRTTSSQRRRTPPPAAAPCGSGRQRLPARDGSAPAPGTPAASPPGAAPSRPHQGTPPAPGSPGGGSGRAANRPARASSRVSTTSAATAERPAAAARAQRHKPAAPPPSAAR